MSNPYDRANPFNTGTRADTFGIRPDLFKELEKVAPKKETIDRLVQSEEDLKHRTDLLEGVQGYAHAYMSRNINVAWSLGNNWRMMPFNAQIGPSVGASVRSDGRVEMGSAGLWMIYAKVHARSTGYTGGGGVTLRLRVYRPSGVLYHESYVRGTTLLNAGTVTSDVGSGSLVSVVPVVIDEPGCYAQVDTWSAAWRWWDGGTKLSSLSVVKQSSNVDNKGSETVPDETESEANG